MMIMVSVLFMMCCLMTFVIPDYRSFDPQKPPAFLRQLIRIVLGALYKSSARKDILLPRVQIDVKGLNIKKTSNTYSKYASFCRYFKEQQDKVTSDDLIVQSSMGCYLEILSLPLHIAIISDPQFPLQAFGLVHVKNVIYQYREIKMEETLNLRAHIEDQRWTDAGLEFDISVIAYDSNPDSIPWKCVATYISRSGRSGGKKPKDSSSSSSSSKDSIIDQTFETKWDLPQNTGLRYANISGDYNPHHLYPITAIPFGFPGPIAHGMYTLSRTIAEVTKSGLWVPQYPFVINAEFKRPLILPAKQISLKIQKLKSGGNVDPENNDVSGLLPSEEQRSNGKAVSAGVYSSKGIPHLKVSFVVSK